MLHFGYVAGEPVRCGLRQTVTWRQWVRYAKLREALEGTAENIAIMCCRKVRRKYTHEGTTVLTAGAPRWVLKAQRERTRIN